MESSVIKRSYQKVRRAQRVRKHLRGSAQKPRLSVMKSNLHIAVQLIDDENSVTLASAGTMMKELKSQKLGRTKEAAKIVGTKIAELAKGMNITQAVFDRGSYKYHGLIAELANAARAGGLQF